MNPRSNLAFQTAIAMAMLGGLPDDRVIDQLFNSPTRRQRAWKPEGSSATGSITKVERQQRNKLNKISKSARKRNRSG